MEIKYIHIFPQVDVEQFEDLLEKQDFNQQLEKLPNVSRRTLVEERKLGGGKRHTVVRYEAKGVPAQARKYIGDEIVGWIEVVDFNRNTHIHTFQLIPYLLKDRIKCEGQYVLEPLGPEGGTIRTVKVSLKVKILGVGAIMERGAKPFLDANAREEERIIREYIRTHVAQKAKAAAKKKKK